MKRDTGRVPLPIIWGALGVLLYVAHVAFIPLALALLFGLVLSAAVEALHKTHVPEAWLQHLSLDSRSLRLAELSR